jgi:signal transduction histidine kinase
VLSRGKVVQRDADGKPYRAVGTHIDTTERRRILEQLEDLNSNLEDKVAERTAQLQAANAAKSQFLAHMSHEIRTPMNAVLGLAQLLEKEPLESGELAMVRHIRESGDALLHIINDILDFSKIEAGQLRIDLQAFTLSDVLSRVDHLLRLSAETKGLTLVVQDSTDCGTLMGDPLRLDQILINLIGNAIKFTAQGAVTLSVSSVTTDATGVRIRFEVQDTGIGIAPDVIGQLFKSFSQADASITRNFGGTGLGLAISRRLVDLMGGQMGVASQVGQGSTFWFELPLLPANEQQAKVGGIEAQPVVPPVGPQLNGLRVLAVDDSRLNLMVVERALTGEGASVKLAADGQQALQILKAQPHAFDVVLMDVQMPVMDGLTATREIRKEPALARLPVIALTAGVLPEERQSALDAGVNEFLAKPLDLQTMTAMLAPYSRPIP